jgi:hypothetical protein
MLSAANNKILAPTFAVSRSRELASAVEDSWTMTAALRRGAMLRAQPASIIDIGAACGEWSQLAFSVFPDAEYVLVEPLHERAAVAEMCVRNLRMRYVAAAAGATRAQVRIDVSSDLDGGGVYGGTSEETGDADGNRQRYCQCAAPACAVSAQA